MVTSPTRLSGRAWKSRRAAGKLQARSSFTACCLMMVVGAGMQFLAKANVALPTERKDAVERKRNDKEEYIEPLLQDGTFRRRYRMSMEDFNDLYGILRPSLERDERGGGPNGGVRGEWSLAGAVRFLAGGSIDEAMMGPSVARPTAYAMVH
ncbi:unnamed protein product [Pylaiella littoralis]